MRGEGGILDLPEVKGFLTVDLMFFFNFFLSIAEDVLDDINKESIREIGITAVGDILLHHSQPSGHTRLGYINSIRPLHLQINSVVS